MSEDKPLRIVSRPQDVPFADKHNPLLKRKHVMQVRINDVLRLALDMYAEDGYRKRDSDDAILINAASYYIFQAACKEMVALGYWDKALQELRKNLPKDK